MNSDRQEEKRRRYVCNRCTNKSYDVYQSYYSHMKKHKNPKVYCCKFCNDFKSHDRIKIYTHAYKSCKVRQEKKNVALLVEPEKNVSQPINKLLWYGSLSNTQ